MQKCCERKEMQLLMNFKRKKSKAWECRIRRILHG